MHTLIRPVVQNDLRALLDIYNHYVRHTHITFEIEPRTLEQQKDWYAHFGATGRYQCFVAEVGTTVHGWASSHRFRERAAYDTSVETSVYLAPDQARKGLGRKLYGALFDALAREDVHRAYGVIALPNAASVALHRACGFQRVAALNEVGRKFDRFWDVAWFEKHFT